MGPRRWRSGGRAGISITFAFGLLLGGAACAKIAGLDGPTSGASGAEDAGRGSAPVGISIVEPEPLNVECGQAAPAPSILTVTNNRTTPVRFRARLNDEAVKAGFMAYLPDKTVTLAPGEKQKFTVNVQSQSLGVLDATLVLTFEGEPVATSTYEVPITANVRGTELSFYPQIVDFGQVRYQDMATPIDVTIKNEGSSELSIGSFAGTTSDVWVTWPGSDVGTPLKIPGNGSGVATVHFAAAPAADPARLNFELKVNAAAGKSSCGASKSVLVSGQRISTDVAVTPGSIDYGVVYCKATPASKTFTIKNMGSKAFSFTVVTPAGFTATPDSSPLSAGGSVDVTLASAQLGATLTDPPVREADIVVKFSPDPGGGVDRHLTARMDVRGLVLQVSPGSRTFEVTGNKTQSQSFSVKNVGNITGLVKYTMPPSGAWDLENDDTIAPGNTSQMGVTFSPPQNGTFNATITANAVQGGPPACNGPQNVTVTGTRNDAPATD